MQETRWMEQRLADIGRRIDALMRRAGDIDGLRSAVRDELNVWRRWRDELNVQAELASMDARDAIGPRIDKVELAFGHALGRIYELLAGADFDADEIRASVEAEMTGLRRELEDATRTGRL